MYDMKKAAALLIFLIIWIFITVTDYVLAICFYLEPFFCIKISKDNENRYFGIGYSYCVDGNFENNFSPNQIEFCLFGKSVKAVYRYE